MPLGLLFNSVITHTYTHVRFHSMDKYPHCMVYNTNDVTAVFFMVSLFEGYSVSIRPVCLPLHVGYIRENDMYL